MNTETPVVAPEETVPMTESAKAEEAGAAPEATAPEVKDELTWSEEIELAGSQLVDKAKELIAEGNVRRLILRTPDNSLVLEIPLMAGAVVGGVLTIFAPLLAVLGAIASVLAQVKIEIVRVDAPTPKE